MCLSQKLLFEQNTNFFLAPLNSCCNFIHVNSSFIDILHLYCIYTSTEQLNQIITQQLRTHNMNGILVTLFLSSDIEKINYDEITHICTTVIYFNNIILVTYTMKYLFSQQTHYIYVRIHSNNIL